MVTGRPPVPAMVRRLDFAIYVRRCETHTTGFLANVPTGILYGY